MEDMPTTLTPEEINTLMLWELEFLGAPGHKMTKEPRWFRMMLLMQKRDRLRTRARKIAREYGFMLVCCAVVVIACAIYGA